MLNLIINQLRIMNEKKYTLQEILASEECEKALEKAEYPIKDEFLFALLEQYYGKYDEKAKEDLYTIEDLENAINDINKNKYTFFEYLGDYYNYLDELVEFRDGDWREQYFDYDSFHEDNMDNVVEASNGVLIQNY